MAWFTEVDLEDLAGGRSFSRGQGYVEAVSNLRDLPDGVVATVRAPTRTRSGCTTPTVLREAILAADLLVTLRGVFARAGRDFEAEVARLKVVHSRKRNFLGALRQRGL